MRTALHKLTNRLGCLAAAALATALYFPSRPPSLDPREVSSLAARFHFEKLPLPEADPHPPHRAVRPVHPSLERISAWVSSLGASATLADLDGDGLPNDLVWVDPRTDFVTVMPVPGTGARYQSFVLNSPFWSHLGYDITALAPMGALAGDFNEDGQTDVMVYFWGRAPVVYLRKTPAAGTTPDPARPRPSTALSLDDFVPGELIESNERWFSNSALQADFDGDGHPDLLIGNYYPDGARVLDRQAAGVQALHEGKSKALNGGFKHLFLADPRRPQEPVASRYFQPQGVFTDEISRGWTLAMAAADLDGDLLPELYLANDFGPDRLLHNRSTPGRVEFALLEGRRGLFTPKSCVLGHDSFKGMGVDMGDINGDGLLDVYVSNIATRFGLTESHFLWLNTGDTAPMRQGVAPFTHGSEKLGLARSGFAFEARLADFDNDGVPEAMQACGFIKGKINRWPELQALGTSNDRMIHDPRFWPNFRPGADLSGGDCNPFFALGSDGRYHDLAPAMGWTEPMVSRGIALADVDHDGRLDFVTANQWQPSYFFKNQSPAAGAFLGLTLVHPNGSPALGAVARMTLPGGRRLIAQVDGGSGHSGHRSPEIQFGIGPWPPGLNADVDLSWRDQTGRVHRQQLVLSPGWHKITLGGDAMAAHARQPPPGP